jgi:hypothetical protein
VAITPYRISVLNLNQVADVLIDGVTSQNLSTGLAEAILHADGAVDPTFIGVGQQAPVASVTTTKVATVLGLGTDTFATVGQELSASCVAEFYCQQMDMGGTRTAGATHVQVAVNEGLLVPRTLAATHGNTPATITIEALATYDGSNNPFTLSDSTALPASIHADECYFLGPLKVNGTALSGLQSVTVDFGLGVEVLGENGEVFPTFAGIGTRSPRIRATVLDVGALVDLGLSGTVQGGTDSVLYFTHGVHGGTRVANATETHISITLDDGLVWVENVRGDGRGNATADVVFVPTYDGTNTIMVVDTTAAIA